MFFLRIFWLRVYQKKKKKKKNDRKQKQSHSHTAHIDVGVPLPNFCALEPKKSKINPSAFPMLSFIRLINSRKDAYIHSKDGDEYEMKCNACFGFKKE